MGTFVLGGSGTGGGGGAAPTALVQIPAIARFEHPVPATTLFEAANGGSAGLTITLGEPLEYGLDVNNWRVLGRQRYEGTADTPAMNPTLVERDFASSDTDQQDYLGVFANDAAAAADSDYDLTRSQGYFNTTSNRYRQHNANNAAWIASPNQANERARLGHRPLAFPFDGSTAVADYHYANAAAAVQYIVDTNFAAGTTGDDTRYSFDRDYVYFDQAESKLKVITDLTAAQSETTATFDIPTKADGGIRAVSAQSGEAGNGGQYRLLFNAGLGNGTVVPSTVGGVRVLTLGPRISIAAFLGHLRGEAGIANSTTVYGTATGGERITDDNGFVYADSGGDYEFTGAVDEAYVIPAIAGEPAQPIHLFLDPDRLDSNDMPAPALFIYYNNGPRGALTEADTAGAIRDYINTHLEGLTAEFVGGADGDTAVTRDYDVEDQFAGGALSGLLVLLEAPLAAGSAGNNYTLKARERFAGGAPQVETQATADIFTAVTRTQGVRITLDADILSGGEDVSSGELGNEWEFVAAEPTDQNTDVVRVSPGNRTITYYGRGGGLSDSTSGHLLAACNQGGTGCSAAYFGNNLSSAHVFAGSLANVNRTPRRFTGGLDPHAGGSNDPIKVSVGPSNATARVADFGGNGGVEFEFTDPAGTAANGWVIRAEDFEGLATLTRDDDARELVLRADGSAIIRTILALVDTIPGLVARIYGASTAESNVASNFRQEFTGGLDGNDIEVQYAPVAKGNIASPDTMGGVKAIFDAVDGILTFYYGGADAATTAIRHTPWKHEFENGRTETISLAGFGLGPEENEFTGNTRAEAEAARNTYAAANPAWVEGHISQWDGPNPGRVWIALRWGSQGEQVGQVLRAEASNPPADSDWISQDLSLKGGKGDQGDPGPAADLSALEARVAALEAFHREAGTYWFGWSDDDTIEASDFSAFQSVDDFEGTLPSGRTTNGHVVAAVPESEGVPTGIYIAGGDNSIDGFTRQAGTLNDPNGDPHIVMVSNDPLTYLFAGQPIRVEFG